MHSLGVEFELPMLEVRVRVTVHAYRLNSSFCKNLFFLLYFLTSRYPFFSDSLVMVGKDGFSEASEKRSQHS